MTSENKRHRLAIRHSYNNKKRHRNFVSFQLTCGSVLQSNTRIRHFAKLEHLPQHDAIRPNIFLRNIVILSQRVLFGARKQHRKKPVLVLNL
jgi:hypothetical protein